MSVRTNVANVDNLRFAEEAGDPSQPASGKWLIYFKSDGLYYEEDDGTVTGPLIDSLSSTPLTTRGDLLTMDADPKEIRLAVGTTEQYVGTADGVDVSWITPGCVLIDSGQETSDAASISITGIPNNGYKRFQLVIEGMESDLAASAFDTFKVWFNNVATATEYDSGRYAARTAAISYAEVLGTVTGIECSGTIAAANADDSCFGNIIVDIFMPDDANDWTHIQFMGGVPATSAGESILASGIGLYEDKAAITQIDFAPVTGTTFLIDPTNDTEPDSLDWQLYGYY